MLRQRTSVWSQLYFQVRVLIKNGNQTVALNTWTQVTGFVADAAYPGSEVVSNAVVVNGTKTGATITAYMVYGYEYGSHHPGAMLARGDALQAIGKPEQAIEAYKRASTLAPTSALPHALRAQTFERMKRPAEAEQAYREGLKLIRTTRISPTTWPSCWPARKSGSMTP